MRHKNRVYVVYPSEDGMTPNRSRVLGVFKSKLNMGDLQQVLNKKLGNFTYYSSMTPEEYRKNLSMIKAVAKKWSTIKTVKGISIG